MNLTGAGLRIDDCARVIGADGTPVPGLFAAGECVGGLLGPLYMGSGNALGLATGIGTGRRRGGRPRGGRAVTFAAALAAARPGEFALRAPDGDWTWAQADEALRPLVNCCWGALAAAPTRGRLRGEQRPDPAVLRRRDPGRNLGGGGELPPRTCRGRLDPDAQSDRLVLPTTPARSARWPPRDWLGFRRSSGLGPSARRRSPARGLGSAGRRRATHESAAPSDDGLHLRHDRATQGRRTTPHLLGRWGRHHRARRPAGSGLPGGARSAPDRRADVSLRPARRYPHLPRRRARHRARQVRPRGAAAHDRAGPHRAPRSWSQLICSARWRFPPRSAPATTCPRCGSCCRSARSSPSRTSARRSSGWATCSGSPTAPARSAPPA